MMFSNNLDIQYPMGERILYIYTSIVVYGFMHMKLGRILVLIKPMGFVSIQNVPL